MRKSENSQTAGHLIILHGWQSSKEKWQKVKEELEKEGIEVIIPDLPGFKPETTLKKPWNLDDYLNWFINFIEQKKKNFPLSKERFFLLGHSFGGRIAIKFASIYSKEIRGLILVSAAGIKKKPTLFRKILIRVAETVKKLKIEEQSQLRGLWQFFKKCFYRYILRKTDYLEAQGALKETIKNVLAEDLTPLLDKISVSTLIIWGEKDRITPLADAWLMAEKIKNSRLEILKNISHTPHLEDPEFLAQTIKKFVISELSGISRD